MSFLRPAAALFAFVCILAVSGCGSKEETPTPPPADAPKVAPGTQSFGGLANPYNPPEKTGKKKAK